MTDYIQSTDPQEANDADAADEISEAPLEFVAPVQVTPARLDKVLAQLLPEYSRSRLQQWIDNQQVTMDERAVNSRSPVYGGERIRVLVTALPEALAFRPEPVPLNLVHEDQDIFVVNKPAGLVVHPAAGNWGGTLLNGLLYQDAALLHVPRAGIVHRLDKDTSGLMVVARTLQAQTDLVRQLQARSVKREYLALVWGELNTSGSVAEPIARDPRNPLRMAVQRNGKAALTHYAPLAHGALPHDKRQLPVTLVQCRLETGRTHQIRVHMQHLGFPLVGDQLYGRKNTPEIFARQALHAWQLGLMHPRSGEACQWRQGMPEDMQQLLTQAGVIWNPD